MITTLLIAIITLFLRILVVILPSWGMPDILLSGFTYFYQNIILWSAYFPIEATVNCLILIIGFHLIMMVWHFAVGVISIMRGGGTMNV